MARKSAAPVTKDEPDYAEYLEKGPTQLVEHITEWLLDQTGFDPDTCESMEDAFAWGVQLTVALRPAHQASPENQARLDANRERAEQAEAEREQRRADRSAGKTTAADTNSEETPKRGPGRPRKAATTEDTETVAPKRPRGRPRKDAAETTAESTDNVEPIRGRKGGQRTVATATTAAETTAAAPRAGRRKPAKRDGEAAF